MIEHLDKIGLLFLLAALFCSLVSLGILVLVMVVGWR